jgi:hypothetical protein
MWNLELSEIGALTPADQSWVIARAHGGERGAGRVHVSPAGTAERLEELGWWLAEAIGRAQGAESEGRQLPSRAPIRSAMAWFHSFPSTP